MKISISNIAWNADDDKKMYQFLADKKIDGVEIAPTRIIPNNPYQNNLAAKSIQKQLFTQYNLEISSMQSILFGREEKLFGTKKERIILIEYLKQAINFAKSINCKNLVFGSPKNRIVNNIKEEYQIAINFFKELGDYAFSQGTILSIEANPIIYGTNFINLTSEAISLVNDVDSHGFKLNLDTGTIIQNNENINLISKNINLINHVHISEPNLVPIKERSMYSEIANILRKKKYDKFISIEMKNNNDLDIVKSSVIYIQKIFNDV